MIIKKIKGFIVDTFTNFSLNVRTCCAPSTFFTLHNTPPLLSFSCPMPLLPVLFKYIDTFIINLEHEQALNQEIEHQIFRA
jgi:hypothetical protein